MPAKTVKFHVFERTVKSFDCSIRKTTNEWEVVDNLDGSWICGFATVSGREVKITYVKNFEKLIRVKRGGADE